MAPQRNYWQEQLHKVFIKLLVLYWFFMDLIQTVTQQKCLNIEVELEVKLDMNKFKNLAHAFFGNSNHFCNYHIQYNP